MEPNRRLAQYLEDDRSLLVREIKASEQTPDKQVRALEYAHASWLTVVKHLHRHKPLVAKRLASAYEQYKVECKASDVSPLPPWLYDYEHCVFLIDVNVLPRGQYKVEQRTSISFTVPKGGVAESVGGDTDGRQGTEDESV